MNTLIDKSIPLTRRSHHLLPPINDISKRNDQEKRSTLSRWTAWFDIIKQWSAHGTSQVGGRCVVKSETK
jgi:hypothetical protein